MSFISDELKDKIRLTAKKMLEILSDKYLTCLQLLKMTIIYKCISRLQLLIFSYIQLRKYR